MGLSLFESFLSSFFKLDKLEVTIFIGKSKNDNEHVNDNVDFIITPLKCRITSLKMNSLKRIVL